MSKSYIFTQPNEVMDKSSRYVTKTPRTFVTVGSIDSDEFSGAVLEILIKNMDNTVTALRTIEDISNKEDRGFELVVPAYSLIYARLLGGSTPNLQIAFRPYV